MEFQVQYDEENKCISCIFSGQFDIDMLKPAIKNLKQMESRHTCKKFISDIRKLKFEFSNEAIYKIPDLLFSLGIDISFKRAILVSESDLKYAQFFTNVMNRKGYTVECFLENDNALEWLK